MLVCSFLFLLSRLLSTTLLHGRLYISKVENKEDSIEYQKTENVKEANLNGRLGAKEDKVENVSNRLE